MAWHKFATIKTDGNGSAGVFCLFDCASAQGVDYEVHVVAETKPDTIAAIYSGSSLFDTNTDVVASLIKQSPNTSYQLWLDLTTQTYTSLLVDTYDGTGTIPSINLSNSVLDVATYSLNNIGLQTITGITSLTALDNINISNNSMTSAQVNAIVDDVFDMAITNVINNGTLNITGNDAPTGDSLLAYNALVGFGWNSGTPITEISNRFELEAIGLLLNGNFNQTDNINLDGAGAVWLDTDGTTVVSSPVVGGSLDISGCNNYYTDAVISGTFTGSFDGNNHHIYNLAIKQQTDVEKYCGLFEQGNGCQITKLTVSGNMQAYGTSGSGYSGGVIGYVTGSSATIDKSISNVNCLSGSRVGGFVGLNDSSSTITDCYSTGDVSSSSMYAGGFVGYNRASSTITDCYATGDVSSSGNHAGGFVGINQYSATITDCYSTGAATFSGDYVGGFVGYNIDSATITDCYSTGAASSSGSRTGGFVGWNDSSATITTSFCYGEISGTSTTKGAFAGRNGTSDILDCYYRGDYYAVDFPAIGVDETGETNTADITPLTEAEFKDQDSPLSNFNWLDFEMLPNADYPTLKWETDPDYDRTKLKDIYEVQSLQHALSLQAELTNNIDAAVTVAWNAGAGFVPIGDNNNRFNGIVNGNGFKIENLYINRYGEQYQGLFGYIHSGEAYNLLVDGEVVGGQRTGILAGVVNSAASIIQNCVVSGSLTAVGNQTGAFVGYHIAGTVRDCYGIAEGGFELFGWTTSTSKIYNCFNYKGKLVNNVYTYSPNLSNLYQSEAYTAWTAGEYVETNIREYEGVVYRANTTTSEEPSSTATDWDVLDIKTLTAAEFRNKANFTGFDFDEVWVMGRLHPELRAFSKKWFKQRTNRIIKYLYMGV